MMQTESDFNAPGSNRSTCPCGSGKTYAACCGKYISGDERAPGAEALMRSRYTAFANGEGGYLFETLHPAYRSADDAAALRAQAGQIEWLRLVVKKSAEQGETATVAFKAYYRTPGGIAVHVEHSRFVREAGRWFYTEGEVQHAEIGRNEPCPCGSGKKYKRCCGG